MNELTRVLSLVEMTDGESRQPIGTLSGGQFQQLLLAFALLGRPTVLLFDEPTAGMDEPGEESLYHRFNRLRKSEGFTLLVVSHELSLVYRHRHHSPYQSGTRRVGGARARTIAHLGAGASYTVFLWRERSRLVIVLVSPELARTAGVKPARLNLMFLLAFAMTVALGLRFLGVLLMGSLINIPATTAKHLACSMASMRAIAVVLAILSTLAGSLLVPQRGMAAGPLIILIVAAVFMLSLFAKGVATR